MKKSILLLVLLLTISFNNMYAQVGINTDGSQPDNSAMLDIKSTDKGILIPRMTQAQRDAIQQPANGLMIYQTDNTPGFYFYNGISWNHFNGVNWINDLNDGKSDANGSSVFLGINAGAGDDQTDNSNIGIGKKSLYHNTIGEKNIAIGSNALFHSTKNNNLIAIGHSALFSADSLQINGLPPTDFPKNLIVIGNNAMKNQKASVYTTVIGHSALETGGATRSIIVGDSALYQGQADSTIVIGNKALFNNIHVDFYPKASVIIGNEAMYNYGNWADGGLYAGFQKNIAIGYKAFHDLTWGERNVVMGLHVGNKVTRSSDNVAIGNGAMDYVGSQPLSTDPKYNVCLGNESGKLATNSLGNTSIGYGAGYYLNSRNVAVGYAALGFGSQLKSNNVAVGYGALYKSESDGNIGIGYEALQNNVNGSYNLALGYLAGINSSGSNNILIGINAGQDESGSNKLIIGNTTPIIKGDLSTLDLTFMGQVRILGGNPAAGKVLTSDANGWATWEYASSSINRLTDGINDTYSVFLGNNSGTNDDHSYNYNTGVGNGALSQNTGGEKNTAFGNGASYNNDSGSNNVSMGFSALSDNISGSQNTALGSFAGKQATGSGNIFIGYQAGQYETGNNKLYIANSSTALPLIGGDFSASRVDINGTIKITGGNPGNGKILSSDANGLASWATAPVSATGSINTHSDVDTSTNAPINGQVLSWNGTNWVPADDANTTYTAGTGLDLTGTTFSLNSGIDNLTDVDVSTNAPSNGQVLSWDGTNWVPADDANTTYTAGTGLDLTGTTFSLNSGIDNLTDVDVSTNVPSNGQVLSWDGSNWVPVDDANTTYTAGTGLDLTGTTFSLNSGIDNLTDVDVSTTAPTNGQVLTWNGTNWVPANASGSAQQINDLSDVDTSTNVPTNGQVLSWDGTNWVPADDATGAQEINDLSDGKTAGINSVFLGGNAGANNGNSNGNTGTGNVALATNTSGTNNSAFGAGALATIGSGNDNTALGYLAGAFDAGSNPLTNLTSGIFIGANTKANASGDTNEIVIGAGVTGLGSNTVVIGDMNITKTALNGKVGIGTTDPKSALQVNGGVQVADDMDTATANKVGTLRYRTDSNHSYVEMCVQTGASSYAWVIIHQETW